MKQNQGSFISGYVKIRVVGSYPEQFLYRCTENGIMLWDIEKPQPNQCEAKLMLQDVKKIRELRRRTNYKISFTNKYGLPFVKNRYLKRKPLLIGLIISFLLLIMISNMIWQVKVTGVPEELETRIYAKLESYGIHPGALKSTIDSPNQIQQLLINDIPELLWVGVDLQGTSYHLEGVEKRIIKDEGEKSPRHLVASKNAVINSMYIKKGQPKVRVNDYVEKGKILVSGAIEKQISNEDDVQHELVAADGEIYATTWYTANITVPLELKSEVLTGNTKQNYKLKLGDFIFPIWPWKKQGFATEINETESKQLKIFRWEFPVELIEKRKFETTAKYIQITKEEAIQRGIEQAKADLLLEIGNEANIVTEKVLHETMEHGKVNLSLYITVEENIALEDPINQGD